MIDVDPIQHYPDCRLPYKHWCHMATDGPLSELHQMAETWGLRRAWFQNKPTHPHDDLTPGKRAQALRFGVHAVSTLDLVQRCYPPDAGPGIAPTHEGGDAMTMLTQEFVRIPRLNRPLKPGEPPRRLGSPGRRFPTISRLCPTDSRLFPDCFPGASRLDMLQLLACPGKGVRIHPVIWASVLAVALQRLADSTTERSV